MDRRRRLNRFYLARISLPPDSRAGTAWQFLYSSRNDRSFILTIGLSVRVFELLLSAGFAAHACVKLEVRLRVPKQSAKTSSSADDIYT